MKYPAIAILVIFMMVFVPVSAIEINPPVQGQSFWCKNDLTKWLCPKPGAQGPQGPEGKMNMTANMTAGPIGPQGPAGEAGAPGGDSGSILYFNNTASDIAGYESIRNVPSSANEVDESVTINASHSPVRVDSYAAPLTITNTTRIPAGLWEFHLYSYLSTVTGTSYINISVFNRTASGTETMLFATRTQVAATVPTAYIIDYVQENDYTIASTDRLVFKIYGDTTTVPDRTFHFVYQGSQHTSHIHTPLIPASGSASSLVAAAGQSIPITLGDNAGATNISIRNYSGGQVASIDSIGRVFSGSQNIKNNITSISSDGVVFIENTNNNFDVNPTISYPVLLLSRVGKVGTTFSSVASFGISRYANTASEAKTELDITLSNGSVGSPESKVMTMRSNGNVSIGAYPAGQRLQLPDNGILRLSRTGFNDTLYGELTYDSSAFRLASSEGQFTFYKGSMASGSVEARLSSTGQFLLGLTSGTAQLHTTGTVRFAGLGAGTLTTDAGGNVTPVSDEKFKTNLHPLKESAKGPSLSSLQKILALSPICGNYNAESGLDTQNTYCWIGTAQDIEKVIPEAVYTKHDVRYETVKSKNKNGEEIETTIEIPLGTDTKSVDDRVILGETILAIQEQQVTINKQQIEIDELKARLDKAGIKP